MAAHFNRSLAAKAKLDAFSKFQKKESTGHSWKFLHPNSSGMMRSKGKVMKKEVNVEIEIEMETGREPHEPE
ncbi:hypothetical protein [Salinimicrobium sp. GXAS 041]|uniref:hypothetical protein n=1 Tax=Salinimicrobium sp. GXAS 041 TaxID=3400806 RepID=UPI003C7230AB